MSAKHPDDGKYVVTQNGQRVSGNLHETQGQAQAEADKTRKEQPVRENAQQAPPPKVVQNLYG